MMLNTKTIRNPFWRNFPARAKQMPSKVSYVSKKKWRHFEFAYFSFFLTHLELKRKLRSYTSVVPSKTIPDSRPKWAKCIPVFRPKRRKNPTRWGGTYVAYIRESPSPPTQDYSLYKYGSRRVCDLCVWRSASLPRSCHFLPICTELMLNSPPPPSLITPTFHSP